MKKNITQGLASYTLLIKKVYGVFVLFCFSLFSGQVHVNDGTLLYVAPEVETTISSFETNDQAPTEIYVMSGTSITNLDETDNYRIVIIEEPQPILDKIDESIANRINIEKKSVLSVDQQEIDLVKSDGSQELECFLSLSDSEITIHNINQLSSIVLPAQPFQLKHLLLHTQQFCCGFCRLEITALESDHYNLVSITDRFHNSIAGRAPPVII